MHFQCSVRRRRKLSSMDFECFQIKPKDAFCSQSRLIADLPIYILSRVLVILGNTLDIINQKQDFIKRSSLVKAYKWKNVLSKTIDRFLFPAVAMPAHESVHSFHVIDKFVVELEFPPHC